MLSGVCENPWERWHDCNIGIWHASEIGFSACRHWFQRRGERSCQGGVCHSSTTPPPSLCSSAGITVFCTFNFLCLNLTRRFCFRFPLYQTEYDNVTWELRDEKISMVPSAFFFFLLFCFFFCWGDELNRRRRVWNQYSMHYNEIIFFFFFHSEKLGFENGVCKPNWIRNGGYFVRYLSNFTVCVSAVEFVWVCATNLLECCRFRALNKCILLHLLSSQLGHFENSFMTTLKPKWHIWMTKKWAAECHNPVFMCVQQGCDSFPALRNKEQFIFDSIFMNPSI